MFGNNRNELRQVYLNCWRLKVNKLPMDPMQEVVANIVELHPEYHQLLEDEEIVDKDFSADTGESNPFLHMSMHIALVEQISTNRPAGSTSAPVAPTIQFGVALGDWPVS